MEPKGSLPGREADQSSPSSADVKNAWNSVSTPPYVFVECSLVNDRETLATDLHMTTEQKVLSVNISESWVWAWATPCFVFFVLTVFWKKTELNSWGHLKLGFIAFHRSYKTKCEVVSAANWAKWFTEVKDLALRESLLQLSWRISSNFKVDVFLSRPLFFLPHPPCFWNLCLKIFYFPDIRFLFLPFHPVGLDVTAGRNQNSDSTSVAAVTSPSVLPLMRPVTE